jgi:hypothetical protein
VKPIGERFQRVLDEGRVKSARDWGLKAGLSGQYVGTVLARARAGEDPDVGIDTAKALADVAKVDASWLAFGQGTIDGSPGRWVELAPRYPNLVEALELLKGQLLPETTAEVQGIALRSDRDLDVGTWQATLWDIDRKRRRQAKTGDPIGRPVDDEDDAPPFGR